MITSASKRLSLRLAAAAVALAAIAQGCDGGPSKVTEKKASEKKASASAKTADVTASTVNPKSAAKPTSRPLAQERVDAVIAKNRPSLLRCYAHHADAATGSVELMLMIDVAADGSVKDGTAAGGKGKLRKMRGCIEDALRTWTFPAPGRDETVSGPVVLAPKSQ